MQKYIYQAKDTNSPSHTTKSMMNTTGTSFFVQQAANRAMGDIGTRAIPILIQTLKNEDMAVRANTARALQSITGQSFGENAEHWQAWWETMGFD
jgi:HEAT repeat protein